MSTYIENRPYLGKERVKISAYPELVVCYLCEGILWLPKDCKNCETPYCSSCIKARQIDSSKPIMCPNKCSGFIEHECSKAVLYILGRLEVKCRNTLYGCDEIIPYNSLETHEEVCGYRQITCDGCQQEIAKKDFKEHHSTCPLVLLKCPECATVYQRQNATYHTETKCLREQLLQQRKKLDELENLVNRFIQSPNISEVME